MSWIHLFSLSLHHQQQRHDQLPESPSMSSSPCHPAPRGQVSRGRSHLCSHPSAAKNTGTCFWKKRGSKRKNSNRRKRESCRGRRRRRKGWHKLKKRKCDNKRRRSNGSWKRQRKKKWKRRKWRRKSWKLSWQHPRNVTRKSQSHQTVERSQFTMTTLMPVRTSQTTVMDVASPPGRRCASSAPSVTSGGTATMSPRWTSKKNPRMTWMQWNFSFLGVFLAALINFVLFESFFLHFFFPFSFVFFSLEDWKIIILFSQLLFPPLPPPPPPPHPAPPLYLFVILFQLCKISKIYLSICICLHLLSNQFKLLLHFIIVFLFFTFLRVK